MSNTILNWHMAPRPCSVPTTLWLSWSMIASWSTRLLPGTRTSSSLIWSPWGCKMPSLTAGAGRANFPSPPPPAAAALTSLNFARPAAAVTNAGKVTSQGDHAIRADTARTMFGLDGSGVTVGVLSDSFNCMGGAAGDVASGDLSPVNVTSEISSCTGATDEGRAMLQIVHDVAPGASLSFA